MAQVTKPTPESSTDFRMIAMGEIAESKSNPRKFFDEAALKELATSIHHKGVLQPILVRPSKEGFELVCGARRFRAAKIAELIDIPAMVRDLSDQAVLEIQVIENLQREDIGPLEESEAYALLIKKYGYDAEQLGARVGRPVEYINRRLILNRLSPKSRKKLEKEGGFVIGAMELVASLEPDFQTKAIEATLKRNYSINELRNWIRRELLMKISSFRFKTSDATLLPAVGACTSCPKNTNNSVTLFPDDPEAKGCCTDPVCYESKCKAFEDRAIEEAKKRSGGSKVALLSTEWTDRKNVVNSYDWKRSNEQSKDARIGVIINGKETGKIVWFEHLSVSQWSSAPVDPVARAKRKEVLRLMKAETLARAKVLELALEKLSNPSVPFALDSLIVILAGHLATRTEQQWYASKGSGGTNKTRDEACEILGIPVGNWNCLLSAKDLIKSGPSIHETLRSILIMGSRPELPVTDNRNHEAVVLEHFAAQLDIDFAAIRKEMDWETLSKKQKLERETAQQTKKTVQKSKKKEVAKDA